MAVVLRVPANLRAVAGGSDRIEVQGSTLEEVFKHLDAEHRALHEQLVDDAGRPRRHLRLYVNEDDASARGMDMPVRDGDEILVLLALAGG